MRCPHGLGLEAGQQQLQRLGAALDEARAQREALDVVQQTEVDALSAKVQLLELENSQVRPCDAQASSPRTSQAPPPYLDDKFGSFSIFLKPFWLLTALFRGRRPEKLALPSFPLLQHKAEQG